MEIISNFIAAFADFMWGTPILILLLGGGFFFLVYSEFIPFKHFGHGINVLRGHYDNPNDPGEIKHIGALASSLAATVGMGNISGVALAISTGGPGALFWMWMSALLGVATKYFTCTLSVMYRKTEKDGHVEGGPMYIITEGLSKKWHPLAYLFSIAGLMGTLPMFEANQLTEVVRDLVLIPNGVISESSISSSIIIGAMIAGLVSLVIFGGLQRIAKVASKMVPSMVIIYMIAVLYILLSNFSQIPASFMLIIEDAFTAKSVLGGALGSIIITGAKRAAFSNEAGIGTAPMMHGEAKTNEPVQEGLVAMLGPVIDTIIVCTLTALAIIITGVWKSSEMNGVSLTASAFNSAMPGYGNYVLTLCVAIFAMTTLFTFNYYGYKCWGFLFGKKYIFIYNYIYIVAIIIGSIFSIDVIINLIDGSYAVMAIPTVTAGILLAPKVKEATKDYFRRLKQGEIIKHK
ncbi:alanine/glycine:cation symporter family protein [Aureibacter tunicatorum]|uniref:AGCS family alanine or glycine:cation symporter n=1 Tax=Aureibacter tunicatorum TaxID=866807 RepID=A0AAE3XT71_9BACT|nr:alanine/glycine:cation symporter family protein [Aureibacter tunicatorum]MDR6241560.1 AGCS family alanine or glycine:cation symporter [Aureibacter tunicatorum]BDD07216.1 sodium:alanine symporter [Aureibacter tunicatorum]